MTNHRSIWDQRLLGTWKSDRRRTFKHWKPSPGCSAAAERKFKGMFGMLIVTWKRGKMISGFQGEPSQIEPYEVVAQDGRSVVIRCKSVCTESQYAEDRLSQIHFEEDYYWIALGEGLCEYFRKIE